MNNSDTIRSFIASSNWDAMNRMLGSLSNMEFKRMEQSVRTSVLADLPNDLFWEALLHLIIYKRAAFITGVTACEHLVKDGSLDFKCEHFKALYEHLHSTHPESVIKIANMMFPYLQTQEQVTSLFESLHIDDDITRLSVLLKMDSPLSYYLVFRSLRMLDCKEVARRCSLFIMKRKNDMAFNMVSLVKTYWAIDDLPAQFSLNIEPYELSHIDQSYQNFLNILTGKRPKVL